MIPRSLAPALLLLTVVGLGLARVQAQSAVRLVSAPDPTLPAARAGTGNGASETPRFSRDGRFLAFTSVASNLVTNDVNGARSDVYLRDLETRRTALVSVGTGGLSGNGDSMSPAVSGNGRWVAFVSRASDLVAGDTNGVADVFVRDMVAGTTRRASVATDGTAANGECLAPGLTPDGRYVVFGSRASNLDVAEADADGRLDVFVHDLLSGETRLASGETRPGATADVDEYAISDDGGWVAFVTMSTNVVTPGAVGIRTTGYVRDLRRGGVSQLAVDPSVSPLLRGTLDVREMVFAPGRARLAISAWSWSIATAVTNAVQILDLGAGGPSMVAGFLGARGGRVDDPARMAFSADGESLAFVQPVVSTWPASLRIWRSGSGVVTPEHPTTRHTFRVRELAFSPDGGRVAFVGAATELAPWATELSDFRLWMVGVSGGGPRLVLDRPFGGFAGGGQPAFAPDGRRLAFQSVADQWVAGDRNAAEDVFLADLEGQGVEAVSEPVVTHPATVAGGSTLMTRGISADGRRVLFSSLSDDLVPDDAKGVVDLFVRDVAAGRTMLVTIPGEPGGPARPGFGEAVLSGNGRFVAFTADFRAGEGLHSQQVYLRDLTLGRTRAVALGMNGELAGLRSVAQLRLSADGRYVAFFTDATTLAPDSTSRGQAILRDLETGRNWRVDSSDVAPLTVVPASALTLAGLGGKAMVSRAGNPPLRFTVVDPAADAREETGVPQRAVATLSYDGRRVVVLDPVASGEAARIVRWRDAGETGWHELGVAADAASSTSVESLSRDGRWLVLRQRSATPGDVRSSTEVFDLGSGAHTALEVVPEGDWSQAPISQFVSLSAGGRVAVFQSEAADLVAGDPNPAVDVFHRDLVTLRTTRVRRSPDGPWERAGAYRPLLSADGRRLVFDSQSAGFLDRDGNGSGDVFAIDLPAAPATDLDQDGLDDLWERAWFGNLFRDGRGDFDGDGLTELAEHIAGTCPIDDLSRFQVVAARAESGATELAWLSEPGRRYRIWVAEALGAGWVPQGEVLDGSGTEVRVRLGGGAGESGARFFRVGVESVP